MNDTVLENQKILSQTKPTELVSITYLLLRPAFTIIFRGVVKLIINTCRIVRADICAILRSKRTLQFNTTNTSV